MGVRGLFSFLKPHSTWVSYDQIPPGSRIGIDISYYLYRWQADIEKTLAFLREFKRRGHSVLLVFDGRASEAKQEETMRRRTIREEESKSAQAIQDALSGNTMDLTEEQKAYLQKVADQHARRGWQCTREIRHAFKNTLYEEGIPMLKAMGEADHLLTSLAIHNQLDIVISGDMDLLVLGVPIQYVPQGDGLTFRAFDRGTLLNTLGICDTQFRAFCAMCSTEIAQTHSFLDIRHAYHGIRVFRTLENLQERHGSWLPRWPTADHAFLEPTKEPFALVREDERDRWVAWILGQPMPYTDMKPSSP